MTATEERRLKVLLKDAVTEVLEALCRLSTAGLQRESGRGLPQSKTSRNFPTGIQNLATLLVEPLYRIRVGDYRIGFVFEQSVMTFVRSLDRKEIYRYFP
ncbi:MAG TPA: type II toxin-antitoxin system RelE/ParE family toxin [Verrucomicrobiota bacterium]|nr:type II toxin-antitoxin system RelE/ParE family toxin [Verrucomicrobiota bacterium]